MVEMAEVVSALERTPRALRGLLAGLDEAWLRCDEGPDTFSPLDVLGHLIHGEDTDWMPRLRLILEHGPARPFDPFDRFAFRSRFVAASVEENNESEAAPAVTVVEPTRVASRASTGRSSRTATSPPRSRSRSRPRKRAPRTAG